MAFYAGQLREHCDILRASTVQNANGYPVSTWNTLHQNVACDVLNVSGKDFFAAMAAGAQDVITVTLRWINGLSTEDRVRWDGTVYEILEVNKLGAKRDYMQLKCREFKGQARH